MQNIKPTNQSLLLNPTFACLGISFIGFIISILTFFPGWLSYDSIDQYNQATLGVYDDWHPVMMAWWWRQLDKIYQGPALFLIQNLLFYWGGWCLFSLALIKTIGRIGWLLPLCGLWPGLFSPLGMIWKDIAFACSFFFLWAYTYYALSTKRRVTILDFVIIYIISIYAVGVKSNAIVCMPFYYLFLLRTAFPFLRKKYMILIPVLLCITNLFAINLFSKFIQVERVYSLQYTFSHDLLAISVLKNTNLLPPSITQKLQDSSIDFSKLRYTHSNNHLFYGQPFGSLRTKSPDDFLMLRVYWFDAIKNNPVEYIKHRFQLFSNLLCISSGPGPVTQGRQVDHRWKFNFESNSFSNFLLKTVEMFPLIYKPYIYILILLLASVYLYMFEDWSKSFVILIFLSCISFILPHIFIVPANDYRYLYPVYPFSLLMAYVILSHIINRLKNVKKS
jgi:hypothetical protein